MDNNNRSAGGAYASNPYLYMAYQAGSRLFYHNRNISNDAQGITGTFDLTGFSMSSSVSAARRAARSVRQAIITDTYDVSSTSIKSLILHSAKPLRSCRTCKAKRLRADE